MLVSKNPEWPAHTDKVDHKGQLVVIVSRTSLPTYRHRQETVDPVENSLIAQQPLGRWRDCQSVRYLCTLQNASHLPTFAATADRRQRS
jgi:hypothetical protein